MAQCNSLILHCMDFRFINDLRKFMQEQEIMNDCDVVSFAGAALDIVKNELDSPVFQQIKLSHDLHKTKKIYLVHHQDCGAYGGSAVFESFEQELARHKTDMRQAKELILHKMPTVEVIKVFGYLEKENQADKIVFQIV